jgi:hypothetical protein
MIINLLHLVKLFISFLSASSWLLRCNYLTRSGTRLAFELPADLRQPC